MLINDGAAVLEADVDGWEQAERLAGAFLAGYSSPETRRSYRTVLHHWFAFCAARQLHPFRTIRRTHVELYMRDIEASHPRPAATTIYRRIATLSAWFRWLEDEDLTVGNPPPGYDARCAIPARNRG